MTNVLVVGYYNKNNLGDELFKSAFIKLFPEINFIFTDVITLRDLKKCPAVFFGGGSFLFAPPNIEDGCLNFLKNRKIFYIGVGAETDIHPIHKDLMRIAQFIAVRSCVDKVKKINSNTVLIPDLVYCLSKFKYESKNNSILIIPNILTVPNNQDPHWKHNSWEHFKFEFSQFLDYLIDEGYNINFLSMCKDKNLNDDWAAIELINNMKYRKEFLIKDYDLENIIETISQYDLVITQRYHGVVLSELARVPYISLYHHDKLKNSYLNEGIFLSYYSSSKQDFIDKFNYAKNIKIPNLLPIKSDIFENIKYKINDLLK